ncbi:MAG: EI24 domain-containing protein [Bacteriovoracaceae bacterium]|nr:EI24 domain-containing protein [Bacteriovoracaceae bacterium]
MKNVFSTWPEALRHIFKDPINLFLFLAPALVSLSLYALMGGYVLTKGMSTAEMLIMKYVISKSAGLFLYYLISGLLMFLFFLLVNWTFVLCVGIIASPFNDMLSSRIEKKMRGGFVEKNRSVAIKDIFSHIGKTLKNELKKIAVIVVFTLFATILNFFPIFYPIAILLLSLLMSAQYLDYSWSRNDWEAGKCFKDIFTHMPSNIVSGLMFLALIAVPFINALVPAVATSYYTVLWIKRQSV